MNVTVGVSNHHLHVTKEDLEILFGPGYTLECVRPLNQPGQFASSAMCQIQTDKCTMDKFRILGPCRSYTQVEISKTDSYAFGINPPIRESGHLDGAAVVTIIGPVGKVTKPCCIIADRHIHIDHETRAKLGLLDVNEVKLKWAHPEKGGILDHVQLKETNLAYFEVHLDTDDANANMIRNGDVVEIIKD